MIVLTMNVRKMRNGKNHYCSTLKNSTMIEVKMTLAEWREMLHPMTTEQIGNMSVTRPSGRFETHSATSYYIPEGYRFAGINALGEFQIKKIEKPAMHGQTAELQLEFAAMRAKNKKLMEKCSELQKVLDAVIERRDRLSRFIGDIRKIVNTSPIYSQSELQDKFVEIKRIVNNA